MDIVKVFAYNTRNYRTKKWLSQEALAEKANLHRTYICAIEREKRSISLDNIQKSQMRWKLKHIYYLKIMKRRIDHE